MGNGNDFFMKMCKEATEELASGIGWKDAHPNTLILAAFGMLSNHLASRIVRPMWTFVGIVFASAIGLLAHTWFG